jgi:hypothetical protein
VGGGEEVSGGFLHGLVGGGYRRGSPNLRSRELLGCGCVNSEGRQVVAVPLGK